MKQSSMHTLLGVVSLFMFLLTITTTEPVRWNLLWWTALLFNAVGFLWNAVAAYHYRRGP